MRELFAAQNAEPMSQSHVAPGTSYERMAGVSCACIRYDAALACVLSMAAAVRLWSVATHTYLIWPDETFQYVEPAHRVVFGSGVITWEFLDHIRSWLLPGMVAGVMELASRFDPDPDGYIIPLRLMCVLASLSVPFVGFQLALRRVGLPAAILTGLLCAFSSQAVYFAPIVMPEPLATDLSLVAIWLGDSADERPPGWRRLLVAGLAFGLASSLRFQYAPVLAVVILVQHARDRRRLLLVGSGAVIVLILALGLLDAITLGAPFQSVWLNYGRNALQGVSSAMGTEVWLYYPAYYVIAWGVLAPMLIACAVLGGVRVPALATAVVLTLVLHSLVPHKELRFVFLATACMPILVGVGLGGLLRRIRPFGRDAAGVPAAVVLSTILAAWTARITFDRATRADDWHRDRSMLQATAAARAVPDVCGLAVRTIWVYRSGGYSYWHRDVPIYFETWAAAQKLEHSDFTLRLASALRGKPVPQFSGALLASNAEKFNVIIGSRKDGLPGFVERVCYGHASLDDPTVCVFVRPGGCG